MPPRTADPPTAPPSPDDEPDAALCGVSEASERLEEASERLEEGDGAREVSEAEVVERVDDEKDVEVVCVEGGADDERGTPVAPRL